MNKEELLKKYNIKEFLKLTVEQQADFVNEAYAQGIRDGDLADAFGVSPSTFLFKIRDKYKKKRNANKFYRKEDLNKSDNKNLALKSDNKDSNLESKVVSVDEIKKLENEMLALKKEIDLLKENKTDVNKDSGLVFNIKDKEYNNNLVLRHYKLSENIAVRFDEFCNEAIINKQVLLGKALEEFLEKYNK